MPAAEHVQRDVHHVVGVGVRMRSLQHVELVVELGHEADVASELQHESVPRVSRWLFQLPEHGASQTDSPIELQMALG